MSCREIKTDDANKAFSIWAREVPDEVRLLHGHGWQSPHWTKEYIVYLHFKTTPVWWEAFVKENYLTEDTSKWIMPDDAPAWFRPSIHCIQYGYSDKEDNNRYFLDTITGESYVYEMKL